MNTDKVELYVLQQPVREDMLSVERFEMRIKMGIVRKLSDIRPDGAAQLVDGNSKEDVSLECARETVHWFASAAAEYAHVKVFEEYMEDEMVMAGLLGEPKPEMRVYLDEYLPSARKDLLNGSIAKLTGEKFRFVGKVTTLEQLEEFTREQESNVKYYLPSDNKGKGLLRKLLGKLIR